MKKVMMAIAFLGFTQLAQADDQGLHFTMNAGLTFGGEKMAETTAGGTLKSGGLLAFGIGAVYTFNPNFQLQALFGYHFDELTADNGSATFERTYLEVIPFYIYESKMRFGVGLMNINEPKYSDPYDDITFESVSTPVFEIDWGNPKLWWGLRYVNVDLNAKTLNGFPATGTIDGSYVGLVIQAVF